MIEEQIKNIERQTEETNVYLKTLVSIAERFGTKDTDNQPLKPQADKPDGIYPYTDCNGVNWIEVKILSEHFFICGQDIEDREGKTAELIWDDATRQASEYIFDNGGVEEKPCTLPSKRQLMLMWVFKDEINSLLRDLDGCCELGNNVYWSSTEYNSTTAWYENFHGGYVSISGKCNSFTVRPFAA